MGNVTKRSIRYRNIKEVESERGDYAKYQLEASQTIFDIQMDVFLYFDVVNELGLVEMVCEFDKESYDDVQEEIYALYGTAAQTHTGAKVGSVYSVSDITEALKLIGVDEDKMSKTAKLCSDRALCVAAITNSDKEEKASFSIVVCNMSMFTEK